MRAAAAGAGAIVRAFKTAVAVAARRRVRALAVAAVCAAGVAIYGRTVTRTYPIADWLFWRLLVLWGWCALFHGACLVFGHFVVSRWLTPRDRAGDPSGQLPTLETLVISAAAGVIAFGLAMYVLGALGLFRTGVAIALPIGMLLVGGRGFVAFARARWAARQARRPSLADVVALAAIAAGVVAVALVYVEALTPEALNYDARWYHLTIAEDYAREGRIVPFLADYNKCFPHLASLVHTWGWLLPGLNEALRCMLALHTELCFLLWTLAGVAAGAAWLAGGRAVRGAWAAFFLFPIIFVYDSNLGGSADHLLGFFAVPAFLATVRAAETLSPRRCALAGALAAGALLVKYQAVYLLVPIALTLGARWLWLVLRGERAARRGLWRGPALLLAAGAVVAAPHFLKNWIFYRNPLYPFLLDAFSGSRPRVRDSALLMKQLLTGDTTIPRGPLPRMLADAGALAFTFSFAQHGPQVEPFFARFRQPVPVTGSLFTLLVPVILFVQRRRRLALGALFGLVALLTWALTYPVDRYLQAVIPILAAVTAAIVARAWELGTIARAGLVALIGLQLVWGGDTPFFAGAGRLTDGVSLLRGGMFEGAAGRFVPYLRSQIALGRRLPRSAVVLFHNSRLSLGVNRKVLQDLPGFQGLIDVRGLRTPRELCALYRSFGITHVVHERGAWPAFSKQEEVLFAALLARHAVDLFHEGEYELFALPSELPPSEPPLRVLSLGVGPYADGIYPVDAMDVLEPLPDRFKRSPSPAEPVSAGTAASPDVIDRVDAVIVSVGQPLPAPLMVALNDRFTLVVSYSGRFSVYTRRAQFPRRG